MAGIQNTTNDERQQKNDKRLGGADKVELQLVGVRNQMLQIVRLKGAVGIDKTPAVEHEEETAEKTHPRAKAARPVWLVIVIADKAGSGRWRS